MTRGACTLIGSHILPMGPVAMALGDADHVKWAVNKIKGAITQHRGRGISTNSVTGMAFLGHEHHL